MKSPSEILKEAKGFKVKEVLAPHEQTILTLREKSYSWRDIATFLCERGVDTDHSKVFRFIHKTRRRKMEKRPEFVVPKAEKYTEALRSIKNKISDKQMKMLAWHFYAHNRTATYTQLGEAAGHNFNFANLHYGGLGVTLGKQLVINFAESDLTPDTDFYSSAIGTAKKHGDEEWVLIMHHELGKALEILIEKHGWFEK